MNNDSDWNWIEMTRMDLEAGFALYKSLIKAKPLLDLMTKNNAAEQAKEQRDTEMNGNVE